MNEDIFKVISPIDESVYLEKPYHSNHDIESTLQKASKVQPTWKQTSLDDRKAICQKVLEYFELHHQAIGEEITHQMGRPIRYSPLEITKGFRERTSYMIEIAEPSLVDMPVQKSDGFNRFIRKEPLGTVVVLSPWNYPFLTSVNAVVPAILSGNCVILKSALQTPLCSERYAEAFKYAGAPDGLFQHLHLDHDQVARLIQDDRVNFVAFTGSVEGGYAIKSALSNRFILSGMELGGKDPAYVRKDADLDYAIENLVEGAFFNSGQSCCGIERIYVHQSVYHDFIEGFVEVTNNYKLGNPLNPTTMLGPMVRKEAVEFVSYQIEEAVAQGANPLIDPKHFPQDFGPSYLAPQVLTQVNHDMRIMTDETFGPVVGIMAVKNDNEAIELMNDSIYGLTASIWTEEELQAVRIGDQLKTGTCFMNRCDYLDPALAWTGVKQSGMGVSLSQLGFDQLTRPKSFHLKQT